MSPPLPPSFHRQQLILDYASLIPSCPEGIYLSLSPDNPALWLGVLFVREGPYASLTARFSLSFPVHTKTYQYRSAAVATGTGTALWSTSGSGSESKFAPPLLTFQTDIFHPLIVPLTTYTFSGGGGVSEEGVSSKDVEERLPPGAFRVRWGFEGWFGDAGSGAAKGYGEQDGRDAGGKEEKMNRADTDEEAGQSAIDSTNDSTTGSTNTQDTPDTSSTPRPSTHSANAQHVSSTVSTTLALLNHLHATFTKAEFLDTLPLSHAANTSAWHAWRSYRDLPQTDSQMPPAQHERGRSPTSVPDANSTTLLSENETRRLQGRSHAQGQGQGQGQNMNSPRHPRNWNWDGLFESRVSSSIRESNSDFALYGHLPGSGFAGVGSPRQIPVGLVSGSGLGFGAGIGPGGKAGGAGGGIGVSGIKFEKLDRERLSEIRKGVRREIGGG